MLVCGLERRLGRNPSLLHPVDGYHMLSLLMEVRMALVRTATLSSKGQVTIPLAVRKALKLKQGDVVRFVVDGDSATVELVASEDPFSAWAGAWREGQGKTIEEIVQDERELRGW